MSNSKLFLANPKVLDNLLHWILSHYNCVGVSGEND